MSAGAASPRASLGRKDRARIKATFQRFRTDSFVLVDALVGYDLGVMSPRLEGLNLALNVANLFDERHVTACPFHNSCYFGAARTVIGSIRYAW
jgi:iron complex outermembrane receptor protein